jgi:hypothetical protein
MVEFLNHFFIFDYIIDFIFTGGPCEVQPLWEPLNGQDRLFMGDYGIITYSCEGLVMVMKRLPIGISDFEELVKNDYYYVDTTKMIADVYRDAAKIILLTRPRRFGKTLNMSMLSYFFDNRKKTSQLFEGLDVAEDVEVMGALNAYPTIFITFKDTKDRHWDSAKSQLMSLLSKLYSQYEKEVESVFLNDMERQTYQGIIYKTGDLADFKTSLFNLTEYLYRAYQKPVILIIDEYDVPIQSGWSYGYYDDVIDFMRGLLSGALKDNSFLFKGVLTGIYRVAWDSVNQSESLGISKGEIPLPSIFSGLNNLSVFTVMNEEYATYFGFTETEVERLFNAFGVNSEDREAIQRWYNGYNFGGHVVYNPWSLLNYLRFKDLKPYWINTSSNNLIIEQIEKNMLGDETFRISVEELIAGNNIEKRIDDASALRELDYDPDSIWTLFLFSGYLKAENKHFKQQTEEYLYDCSLPNTEVLRFYKKTVINWLQKPARNILYDLANPLITGDGEQFCEKLKKYVLNTLSYYDLNGEPENTYHMILLGMFAHLTGGYWILSNRESGKGRFDILLKAKNKDDYSAVIEIKAGKHAEGTGPLIRQSRVLSPLSSDNQPKPLERAADDGMRQIKDKAYVQELVSEGYTRILKISLAVDGKDIEAVVEKS